MIDLKDSIVVLGSGLSGAFTAKELLKSNHKVTMIDAGYTRDAHIPPLNKNKTSQIMSSYKFKLKSNEFAYADFALQNDLETKNFHAVGSLAAGGLSNIWGGGLSKFEEYEYQSDIFSHDEITNIYSEIQKEMQAMKDDSVAYSSNQEFDKRLEKLFAANLDEITFSPPINAINQKSKYWKENNNKNHGIFSASTLINELKKNKRFEVISNNIIHGLSKDGENYVLQTRNSKSNQNIKYSIKNVFCCLGVISSTQLILKMEEAYNAPTKLCTTPLAYFLAFTGKKRENSTQFGLSSLSFRLNNENASGGLFPCNEDMLSHIKLFRLLPAVFKTLLDKVFLQRLFVVNIFFHSNMSNNKISISNKGQCNIIGRNNPSLKFHFKRSKAIIKKELKRFNIFVIPVIHKIATPGSDVHYGGTIPIKINPEKLNCDSSGRLHGHKAFYVADACSLESIPGKPHSFHSIAQSIIIARRFIYSQIHR